MQPKPMVLRGILRVVAAVTWFAISVSAHQSVSPVPNRIAQPVDESQLTTLKGNTHPLARPEYDRGPAPASLPLNRMLLVLSRSPEQETALEALLDQQQDKSSPNYHVWLTPEQFGQQFGPSNQDIQTVSSWLQSHGFTVSRVSKGRTTIEFSGTAAQVQQAFHTEIHKYTVNGEDHWANASDSQIPAALASVVAGPVSLNNFRPQSMSVFAGTYRREKTTGEVTRLAQPQFTFPIPCSTTNNSESFCNFGVGPYDLATIYAIPPLGTAADNGTGQTIAIVAETDINPQDFADFHTLFGLPASTLNVIHDGPDPGILGDESEADIDTQWSSAVAPGATIDFVVSEPTETTRGVDLSAEYIVDNNLAPVMSESYGICELGLGTSGNQFFSQIWQQAAAQGITVFVSSGDQGSAVCDRGHAYAEFGLEVNGFASTPYNVAVGGTDFNDINDFTEFWSLSNNSTTQSSALSYIPEMTWNDSCTNSEVFSFFGATTAEQVCNNAQAIQEYGLLNTIAGSGGMSSCTTPSGLTAASCSGGYAKPSWQKGEPSNLQSDGKRDMPDISLFASNGFNDSFYIVCQSDLTSGACNLNAPYEYFAGFGGTSVSSPAFAGIMALINQKYGRQGNANYVLYNLASQAGKTCTSAATTAASCVFHDIPTGSTIAVPCLTGSPDCTTKTSGDAYGVLSGYSTTAGYDLATGLGSVNVANLVSGWPQSSFAASSTTIASLSPTTLNHGATVNVTINVKAQSGTNVPTGLVSLLADTGAGTQQAVGSFALTSGTCSGSPCAVATGSTNLLPGGTYNIVAHYPGDSTFGSSDSAGTQVTVSPEASTTQVEIVTFNSVNGLLTSSNATTFAYGASYLLRANVDGASGLTCAGNGPGIGGCPSGTVTITDNGSPLDGEPAGSGEWKLNSQGYAEDQAVFLMAGQHNLVAQYGGDTSFNKSTSPTDSVTVTKSPTTISLSASPMNVLMGDYVLLTATISTQAIASNSLDYPSGTVQFLLGSTPLTGQVSYTVGINSSTGYAQYVAALSTNALPIGLSTITAQYLGDINYAASGPSNSVSIDSLAPVNVSISSSNLTIQHGSSVTFTAKVTPNISGGPAPTGNVTFTENSITIGTIPLANGQAQLTTSSLPGGSLQIVATYAGDTNYASSLAILTETVNLLSSATTIMSSNTTTQQGSSVTFTANVAPTQSGGPTLTGAVQFWYSFSLTGSDTYIGAAAALANGQAQVVTSSLPSGSLIIGATYNGDTNYATSYATLTETVNAVPTFLITDESPSMVISSPGLSSSTTVTFAAQNGFTGSATLTSAMCSNLPSETTCSFNPAAINLTAQNTTQNVSLTLVTTPASAAVPSARPLVPLSWPRIPEITLFCVLCLALLVIVARRVPRQRATALLILLVLAAIATSSSCGGGGGSGGGGGGGNPGTPVGNYTGITVTVTIGNVTQSIKTISLSVQ